MWIRQDCKFDFGADAQFGGESEASLLKLLNYLSCPAIILSESGSVRALSRPAEQLLGRALVIRNSTLFTADRTCNDRLASTIAAALASRYGEQEQSLPPVLVPQPGRRPLVVQALSTHAFTGLFSSSGVVLILTGLEAQPELPLDRLRVLFDFTLAEAKLAARLATGESLVQAANALGVALGTARNQLKSIFSKTGTSRQAALVALLWRARI